MARPAAGSQPPRHGLGEPGGGSTRRRRGRAGSELVPLALRSLVVLAFLAGVEAAVVRGSVSPLFVARPTRVAAILWDGLWDGYYLGLIGTTLFEAGVAFASASLVGLLVGYLLWRYRDLGRAFDPLFMGLFASPIVLLYPVFLIIFQRSPRAVIVLAAIGGVIPIIVTTKQALSEVSPTYLKVGYLLCGSRWQSMRRVLLPAAIPGLVSGMVLGLTYTLLTVLAVEFLANIGGLGREISDASSRLRADRMYAALALVIALSATFLYGLKKLERAVARRPSR